MVAQNAAADPQAVLLELFQSGQRFPVLKLNHENIPLSGLQPKLQALNCDARKTVLLRADGQLLFEPVAEVVDRCQGLGSRVVLITEPETY